MATATKTRRQSKPKSQPEPENPVVTRRLAFLSDAKRKDAAKRFAAGESIAKLTEEFGFQRTMHAAYCLRQQLVEQGDVSRIEPTAEAIKKALKDSDDKHNDWHWLACRTGLSTGRVQTLAS
jgi:hypothetical protein